MWQEVQARKKVDKPSMASETGQWKAVKGYGSRCQGGGVLLHWPYAQVWTAIAVHMYAGNRQNSWGPVYVHVILVVCLCALSCLCLAAVQAPLLCSLLHLLRAVRVIPSTGDRLWSPSFPVAHSGFALCPVRCLCRLIHVNGINGGKKEIGLWLQTEMGRGWGCQADDFPRRRMYQCCFVLQCFPWMLLV